MFNFNEGAIKVCACHEEQVPLLWTFKFDGREYWCPACGYGEGMLGAGKNVPETPELLKAKAEWTEKARPYLSATTDEWEYSILHTDTNQFTRW